MEYTVEHFVRVVLEKNDELAESLDESVFPNNEKFETEQGATVYHIPLERLLNDQESDEYADRLSAYLFAEGFEDFDIEISTDQQTDLTEETYDGDDFFEEYGVMWFNEEENCGCNNDICETYGEENLLDEAEYRGRKVKLGKPMRGDVKKFKVYVRDPKTKNIKKVNFGDPNMRIKKSNPARRRSFRARHNCDNPGPRTKARYWSCRKW